jgi:hypothetical protein
MPRKQYGHGCDLFLLFSSTRDPVQYIHVCSLAPLKMPDTIPIPQLESLSSSLVMYLHEWMAWIGCHPRRPEAGMIGRSQSRTPIRTLKPQGREGRTPDPRPKARENVGPMSRHSPPAVQPPSQLISQPVCPASPEYLQVIPAVSFVRSIPCRVVFLSSSTQTEPEPGGIHHG